MRVLHGYLFLAALFFTGCRYAKDPVPDSGVQKNAYTNHAERYQVRSIGEYIRIDVKRPWQNAGDAEFSYLLGDSKNSLPDSLSHLQFIHTPVERVVLMSTTFISVIDTLGELSSIVGVSGADYVYSEKLLSRIDSGLVKDVGYDQGLNYEMIIELDPDVLFLYGVEAGISQTINRLEDLGIKVVICADYLENDPLGRAEWIKFFGLFYQKLPIARKIFQGVEERYDSISSLSKRIVDPPSVFVGLPWKDTWFVPGGLSFAARFIEDAGGKYVWKDIRSAEAEPFGLESVYVKIVDADIWLNAGVANNLKEILDHDERFKNISSFQSGNIYNNNKRLSERGGNDYWESGIIKPDVILNDLVSIFSNQADSLHFYKSLR